MVTGAAPAMARNASSRAGSVLRPSSPPKMPPRRPPPPFAADDTSTACFTFPSATTAAGTTPESPQQMTARQPLRNAFAAEAGSSTATTYGPYRDAAVSGEMPSATTGCLATMSCMMIASPSAVSAPATSVPRRGFLSHSRSSSSSSGVGSATAETPPSPTRSSPGAPTLESWPYHLRSLGPPSMTSSISSNSPFLPLATTDRRRPRS
mmetsp:Transcript_3246/g.12877  ORF Transcript_3246/g.12877 Transcript_3246/m.12877 type:complete len:208 (-) Transcript_3246:165-788(-)